MSNETMPAPGSGPSIEELERQIANLTEQVNAKRREAVVREIRDYTLQTVSGEVRLSGLFAGHDKLLAIHNMGQRCRYCTLWAAAG